MKRKKEDLGKLIIYVLKNKKELSLFDKVCNKLKKRGYKDHDSDIWKYRDYFFVCLDKDKKHFWTFSSIVGPAAMANCKERPIPIEWMDMYFDFIISKDTKSKELWTLHKLAWIYNLKKK